MNETPEQQQGDSDMIFTQITSGDFANFGQVEQTIALIHVPDMNISRSGISHALKRLERHYRANRDNPS